MDEKGLLDMFLRIQDYDTYLNKRINELEKRIRELEIANMGPLERLGLKLKPCPKCGAKAKVVEVLSLLSCPPIRIECSNCRIETGVVASYEEELVIKLWNELI